MRELIGKRIEIPVHFDLWMRGARFGFVSSVAKDGSWIKVKMDHWQVNRRVTIRRDDIEYCRII